MAVKPKDSDTFVREVDEELRRERVTGFMTRYGWYVIGAAVLLLVVIGGYIWWQNRQTEEAAESSQELIRVVEQLEQNNARGAAPAIDQLVESDRVVYRVAGLFSRANAQVATNAIPAAVETLNQIATDEDAPQPYRDAALIRQTQLQFDQLPPAEVVRRLQPYAQAGNPWHGAAGELVAIAYMKAGNTQQAGRAFEALARDQSVPETVRARAVQMVSALGLDAVALDPELSAALEGGGQPAPAAPQNQPQQAPPAPPAN